MQVVHSESPSIPVLVQCGRTMTRTMDFNDRETKQKVHLERRSIQGTFNDCSGVPTICCLIPETGWTLDVSQFERKSVTFYCTSFKLDKTGVCVLVFCGYDIADSNLKK